MESTLPVFRDKLSEDRGDYFVEYRPADGRLPFAGVDLSFPSAYPDVSSLKQRMDHELEHWLMRFAVPMMVSAFDATGSVIPLGLASGESCLMGFVNPTTNLIERRWGCYKNEELPMQQTDSDYLNKVYHDVPFRYQQAVRDEAIRETRGRAKWFRAFRIFSGLVVAVPVLIELVSLGVNWIGYVLTAISVSTGLYKIGKTMGWIKLSKRGIAKAEEERRIRHYAWHCERNPEGFTRLKCENFEKDAIVQTRKEAQAIKQNTENDAERFRGKPRPGIG